MADISIQFQCGCGFLTKEAKKAVEHSDEKYHTLTISGQIKKPEKEK